ncbi:MAG: hypothetical protein HRU17_19255 [Polyangiaceae bacterium]|nr:hypothetical protein [Polyangiaceae bacterium]
MPEPDGAPAPEAPPAAPPTADTPPNTAAPPAPQSPDAETPPEPIPVPGPTTEAGADEEGFGDDADEAGWGGEADSDGFAAVEDGGETEPPTTHLVLTGFFRSDAALWTERFDSNPVAQLRQSIDAQLGYKDGDWRFVLAGHFARDFAYWVDRDSYDAVTIETYEQLALVREAFVNWSLQDVELSAGRQIVVWGEGNMLSPLDMVNPRDLREPGISDLDDLRLPVAMSRVNVFVGEHRFEGLVVHEANFGLLPPPRGNFNPMREQLSGGDGLGGDVIAQAEIRYEHEPPQWDLGAQQYFARWRYTGSGYDLALYSASLLDQQGVAKLPELTEWLQEEVALKLYHPRFLAFGHSGTFAHESSLLKWELGADVDRPVVLEMEDVAIPDYRWERRTIVKSMLGYTYSGFSDVMLSAELTQNFIPEGTSEPTLFELRQPAVAVQYHQFFLRERLEVTAVGSVLAGLDSGWLARADVSYELADAWSVGGGYVTFQPGNRLSGLNGFTTHDRVFAKLRYDFALQ